MNKRGYIQDFLFFGIIAVIFAIVVLFGGRLFGELNTELQNSTISTDAKEISADIEGRYNSVMDWAFIAVFILFGLAIIASFFMLDTHPVFFFGVLIVFAFILMVMGILGNVFDDISGSDDLAAETAQMPVLDWIMGNFLETVAVFGFVGIVVLFAKLRGGT